VHSPCANIGYSATKGRGDDESLGIEIKSLNSGECDAKCSFLKFPVRFGTLFAALRNSLLQRNLCLLTQAIQFGAAIVFIILLESSDTQSKTKADAIGNAGAGCN
jgi:hypothetical protein